MLGNVSWPGASLKCSDDRVDEALLKEIVEHRAKIAQRIARYQQ
ncbi:MAG: hypothetical protein ACRDP6_20425 [Actinoallomurus sp.]